MSQKKYASDYPTDEAQKTVRFKCAKGGKIDNRIRTSARNWCASKKTYSVVTSYANGWLTLMFTKIV